MMNIMQALAKLETQRNVYFSKEDVAKGKKGFLLPSESKLQIGDVYEDGETTGWVGLRIDRVPAEMFEFGAGGVTVNQAFARLIVLWLFVEGRIADKSAFVVEAGTSLKGKHYLNIKRRLTDRVKSESVVKVAELFAQERAAETAEAEAMAAVLAKFQ